MYNKKEEKNNFKLFVIGVASLFVLGILTLMCLTRIEIGHVGLKVSLSGEHRGVENSPTVTGWVWYNPLFSQVVEYPTSMQTVNWEAPKGDAGGPDESIMFSSDKGLSMNADVSLTFYVEEHSAPRLYSRFRQPNIDVLTNTYIRNMVRGALVTEASHMSIEDIYGIKKQELCDKAKIRADKILRPDGIIIDQLTFVQKLRLPPSIEDAINRASRQMQDAITAQNKVAEIEAVARQKVAEAKGAAESTTTAATAFAEATLTRARAQAEANKLLQQSLNPSLIEYEKIQKWDGKVPQIVLGNNASPMVSINN